MELRTRKIIFDAHSWLGVVSALLLFVVCFTGVVALFRYELAAWESPDLRIAENRNIEDRISVDQAIKIAVEKHGVREDEFFINLPSQRFGDRYRFGYHFEGKPFQELILDPYTGEPLRSSESNIARFLTKMHTDLNLPRPFGRYLVGFLGVLMMFSIISGIIAHRRYFKEIFQFRPGKNFKLTFTDMHKVMGAWGILFQLMIAFTGALIGLIGIFLIFVALAAYGGDQEAAIEGFLGPHIEAIGNAAPMVSVDALIDKAQGHWDGFKAQFINVHAFGDEVARVTVSGNMKANLAGANAITYDGVTGKPTFIADFMETGAGSRIYGASFILHYALFGGFLMKVLYMLLGTSMALMTTTGLMMWMEKRTNRNRSYYKLSSLNIGVSLGLVVATAVIFMANKLLPESEAKPSLEEAIYFAAWLLVIIWSFIRKDNFRLTKELFYLSALLFIAVPIANFIITGHDFVTSYKQGFYSVFGVDLTFVILALILLYTAYKWPANPEK